LNFLPDPASNSQFIAQSLDVLRREHPEAYLTLCQRMAGREVLIYIDGEAVRLAFSAHEASLPADLQRPGVTMRTSRLTLLDVIDGQLSLERAVYEAAIELQGHVTDLSAFYDGVGIYVRGAVRCPSFPFLLERYRRQAPQATSSPI
jgi:hypothetical protein